MKPYESDIADWMTYVKEQKATPEEYALDWVSMLLRTVITEDNDELRDKKLKEWEQCRVFMDAYGIRLSPSLWISILEDDELSSIYTDKQKDDHFQKLLSALPQNREGYRMRGNDSLHGRYRWCGQIWKHGKWVNWQEPRPVAEVLAAIEENEKDIATFAMPDDALTEIMSLQEEMKLDDAPSVTNEMVEAMEDFHSGLRAAMLETREELAKELKEAEAYYEKHGAEILREQLNDVERKIDLKEESMEGDRSELRNLYKQRADIINNLFDLHTFHK